eukprot:1665462-Pyramimonas_sp.AAC.1
MTVVTHLSSSPSSSPSSSSSSASSSPLSIHPAPPAPPAPPPRSATSGNGQGHPEGGLLKRRRRTMSQSSG